MPDISLPSLLARLRRVPFWAQALAVCALFAIAGLAILDDYGIGFDETAQRRTTATAADYALGVSKKPPGGLPRYYGVAFEMPLLLAERALGLQDSRDIYLMRHLIMHLFFIAGGFVCGMLAYRMIGNRWIALFAMLMFLLHPRLYAHSFFNVRDIPFAVMLIIALYLTRRAFRRDTIGAFLLCGIGVGLAINLRVFGMLLPPMILAMRALDLWQAGRGERKRILASVGIFAAAALGTIYIVHPYYWENPLRFIEGVQALYQHPYIRDNLFMGEIYRSDAVPWNFIPVWFAITAPPLTLLMGTIGCAAICWQGATRHLVALRAREIRFRVLLLGCFALPVVVVIALQGNIYNGWRHMYFLWGPFCLLAAVGLCALVGGGATKEAAGGVLAWLPGWVRGGAARWALAYSAAGVGLITTLAAMAALHPYEYVYFNALVDTKTPGALAERYDMDYWLVAHRQLLEHLLARHPDGALRVLADNKNARILPQGDRERVVHAPISDADFYFNSRRHYRRDTPYPPTFHSIQAYGSPMAYILAPNSAAYRDYYRAEYGDVEANGTLLARAAFDIYVHNGALHYLSANCAPLWTADDYGVFLHIIPSDPADLPVDGREFGFENLDFWIAGRDALSTHTAFFEGKCITRRPLPDYPIARIRTGQFVIGGDAVWRTDIDLTARAAAQALYESIAAGDYGQPVAQSDFDVYLRGDRLAYIKDPCDAGDADARFFLHIIPANPTDLPANSREHGFANIDFQFADHGAYAGDKCVVERELPGYAIERIRTGQFVSGGGFIWSVEFAAGR